MKNASQFKNHIKKLAQQKGLSSQLVIQNYMTERLLERISLSEYSPHLILKGGVLIASIVGLDTRATMDLDATIKGLDMNEEFLAVIMQEIISLDPNDGVRFEFISTKAIREHATYGGYRVALIAHYFSLRVTLKLDLTLADVITPKEISYPYPRMLEEGVFYVQAYNIETLLAEKLETILSLSTFNTRSRDFYDIYIFCKLKSEHFNRNHLYQALIATSTHRQSTGCLQHYETTLQHIEESSSMRHHWANYQKSYSYAADISFSDTCAALRLLLGEVMKYQPTSD